MNDKNYPSYYPDSLLKAFLRNILGGIGWVVGLTIGSLLVILAFIHIFNRFNFGKQIEAYLQNFLGQVAQQQLEKQQKMLNQIIPDNMQLPTVNQLSLPTISPIPKDFYPSDFLDIIKQNKK